MALKALSKLIENIWFDWKERHPETGKLLHPDLEGVRVLIRPLLPREFTFLQSSHMKQLFDDKTNEPMLDPNGNPMFIVDNGRVMLDTMRACVLELEGVEDPDLPSDSDDVSLQLEFEKFTLGGKLINSLTLGSIDRIPFVLFAEIASKIQQLTNSPDITKEQKTELGFTADSPPVD